MDGLVVSSIMATARPDLDQSRSCARVSPPDQAGQGQAVVVGVHLMLDAPLADEDTARHTLDRTQGIDRLEGMGGGSAIPIVALCSRSLRD